MRRSSNEAGSSPPGQPLRTSPLIEEQRGPACGAGVWGCRAPCSAVDQPRARLTMALIGYARVSTGLQETYMQLDALKAAGVTRVFEERASSVGSRPELQRALFSLRQGDVFVVYKLDRIARSLADLLQILDRIKAAGAMIRSLNEPLDTTSPIGLFVVQVLGAVAQLERSIIRERSMAGQISAMRRGVRFGRDSKLTAEQRELAALMLWAGCTYHEVAQFFSCSRATVWRADREIRGVPDRRLRPIFSAAFVARE